MHCLAVRRVTPNCPIKATHLLYERQGKIVARHPPHVLTALPSRAWLLTLHNTAHSTVLFCYTVTRQGIWFSQLQLEILNEISLNFSLGFSMRFFSTPSLRFSIRFSTTLSMRFSLKTQGLRSQGESRLVICVDLRRSVHASMATPPKPLALVPWPRRPSQ